MSSCQLRSRCAVLPDTYPLDHAAGQVHDADLAAAIVEAGDERAAGRVGRGEVRLGGERPPGTADQAEAAERVGRDAEQDLAQEIRGQHAVVVVGDRERSASLVSCGRRRHFG